MQSPELGIGLGFHLLPFQLGSCRDGTLAVVQWFVNFSITGILADNVLTHEKKDDWPALQ